MKRQRGIALITAILVMALATVAATAILTTANIAVHRAANLQDSERAWWYADGIEAWLLTILERDIDDNDYDGLDDIWAKPVDYLPVDEGAARGQVTDLQGRFNLNNFAGDKKVRDDYRPVFVRLLQLLELDSFQAEGLADAITDWVDADQNPTGFAGGEDSEYLGFNPPYRVANRPMESVTELLAVKGMTRELYQKLRPYVTALPSIGTPINANTAPELLVLALAVQPDPLQKQFIEGRTKKPAQKVSDLTSGAEAPFGGSSATPDRILAVSSNYFLLRAEIFVGSGRLALYSFYYRPSRGGGAPIVYGRGIDSE